MADGDPVAPLYLNREEIEYLLDAVRDHQAVTRGVRRSPDDVQRLATLANSLRTALGEALLGLLRQA